MDPHGQTFDFVDRRLIEKKTGDDAELLSIQLRGTCRGHRPHRTVAWSIAELDVRADPSLFVPDRARVCDRRSAFIRHGDDVELAAFRRHPRIRQPTMEHAVDVFYRIDFDVPEWVQRARPGLAADVRADDRMRTVEIIVGDTVTALQDRRSTRPPSNGPLKRIPAIPDGVT